MPVEKGPLLVCGKTGRVVGLNRSYRWARWLFPVAGLVALVWYLVRVIPKPSRADYPCQRVAAPIAFGGIAYLLSILGLVTFFRKSRKFLFQHRYAAAGICMVVTLVCAAVVRNASEFAASAEDTGTFTPSDASTTPMGTARGINPGRVAWAYDLSACKWNGSANYWFSATNNDQSKITRLMNQTICSVAGQSTISNAWDVLFKYKNGDTAYAQGEKIAIKLNLNNGGNYDNQIDASPQSVYALLDGLVNKFGANQADITLCDPARENQCSAVKDYCVGTFPNVNYDSNLGGFTANAFAYSVAGPTENSLSSTIVNSKYLIVMALLKRHCTPSATWGTDGVDYGNASVTMIFKSNWGNIGGNRGSTLHHGYLHDWSYPMNSYHILVDILGSKHINGKTVLNILDGLYTGNRWSSNPVKWKMAPFNTNWPSSIFASQDPVAIESVGLDFMRAEWPLIKNADRHLHEAAQANNPPSGTVYKPDGVQLPSLGVHEHWNNATDKKYSRNLGTGAGIELVNLATSYAVEITNPPSGSVYVQGTNIAIQATVNNATNPVAQVAFYLNGAQSLGTVTNNPFTLTWSNAPASNYALTAVATDSLGLAATSSPVNLSVTVGTLVWDNNPATTGAQDGSGAWNLATANWWNGTTNLVWSATLPINTIFGAGSDAAGTITLGANVTAGNLAFNAASSGNYTIAGGGYTLTLANTPVVNVANNLAPTISAPIAGAGFSKTGNGTVTLSGANSYSGTLAVAGGTLVLSGNNTGSTAGGSVAIGTTLQLANANGLKGALALNSGSTLQLRADSNTTFSPSSIVLDSAADTNNFDVNSASGAITGKTLSLAGALAFSGNANQTINVTGNNNYFLVLGAISAVASTDHNPYRVVNVNVVPSLSTVIASFTAGNYGTILNLAGGGKVTVTGNLGNTSNGSVLLFVNNGTTATLEGISAKSNTGDAYRYFVPNGTLVLDNNAALTNNTTGTGLNSSLFILGAATNLFPSGVSTPAGILTAANNSYNCAVYLGDANFPNGGLSLRANVTNFVSDGDVGFANSGTFTIGGQNTIGTNTFANPIILGWTANRGKSVTLVAATGGTVDFTGAILRNGTDASAGVKVGDATHGGTVKLTGANTYAGGTTVANGKLLVNGLLAAGAVTVQSGSTIGGTGTMNGPVTIQSGGTLSPGVAIGTLTVNNSLTLAGNLFFELNKSSTPSNDLVNVSGVLTNSGSGILTITNLGPVLVAGDTYKLFSQALANGGALTLNPATPGIGLRWVNNLAVNGSLSVVAVATNTVSLAPSFSISNLTLSWPADHTGWRLQAQTNPFTFGLGTNWADVSGAGFTNQCILPMGTDNGSVFFRLVYP